MLEKPSDCYSLLNDEKLKKLLEQIQDLTFENIWKKPHLLHFTDHGIDHSNRLCNICKDLISYQQTTEKKLNKYELIILYASFILHDIGMQCGNPEKISHIKNLNNINFNNPVDIRKNHALLSYYMIINSIHHNIPVLGLRDNRDSKMLSQYIAEVCKAHSGNDEIKPEILTYRNKKIRLGLLKALLRICDELDVTSDRVNLNELDIQQIPVKSKFFWWLHHYVRSVIIENDQIFFHFIFPNAFDVSIKDVIINTITLKIHNCIEPTMDNLLWPNNIKIRISNEYKIQNDLTTAISNIPDDLRNYIQELIKEDPEIIKHKPKTEIVIPDHFRKRRKDWISYFSFRGNPFVDKILKYSFNEFVETESYYKIESELNGILLCPTGEVKILIGKRGSGKSTTLNSIIKWANKNNKLIMHIDMGIIPKRFRNEFELTKNLVEYIFKNYDFVPLSQKLIDTYDLIYIDSLFKQLDKRNEFWIICIDNLDRYATSDDDIDLIRKFFQKSQGVLQRFADNGLLIISSSEQWHDILIDPDLGYLNYLNCWNLRPFNLDETKNLIEKRLAIQDKENIFFNDEDIKSISLLSRGNPRRILNICQEIFNEVANRGLNPKEKIPSKLIEELYGEDVHNEVIENITETAKISEKYTRALTKLWDFTIELDRSRNLDLAAGYNIIYNLISIKVPKKKIAPEYHSKLMIIAEIRSKVEEQEEYFVLKNDVKRYFSELKKRGITFQVFRNHFLLQPVSGHESNLQYVLDEIEKSLKDKNAKEYFTLAKNKIHSIKSLRKNPKKLIISCEEGINNLSRAIIIEQTSFEKILNKSNLDEIQDKYYKNFLYSEEIKLIKNKSYDLREGRFQSRYITETDKEFFIENIHKIIIHMGKEFILAKRGY